MITNILSSMTSQLTFKNKIPASSHTSLLTQELPIGGTANIGENPAINKLKASLGEDKSLTQLCRDFKQHYFGYEKRLTDVDENFLTDPDIPKYVLFGTSKAGKSLAVALLKESSEPGELLCKIQQDIKAGKKISIVNGIAIGHSQNDSCTVEPCVYIFQTPSGKNRPGRQ